MDKIEKAFLYKTTLETESMFSVMFGGKSNLGTFDDLKDGDIIHAVWDSERTRRDNPEYLEYIKIKEQVDKIENFWDFFSEEYSPPEHLYSKKHIWYKEGSVIRCSDGSKYNKEEMLELTGGIDKFVVVGAGIKGGDVT